jgi:hypothetical protein
MERVLVGVQGNSTRSMSASFLAVPGVYARQRTHVDRDLTTVSRVDRRLGLIKNLGRHKELEANLLYSWTSFFNLGGGDANASL